MLIVGAKGFAKEVLEVVHQLNQLDNLVFYDDVNDDVPEKLFGQFPVLRTIEAALIYFKTIDNQFTIGIGNPVLRKKLCDKFTDLGGEFVSTISPLAAIGSFDVQIGIGSNILSGSVFSNGIRVGKGSIVYYNSVITHDCIIGDFVEISPSVTLLGRCIIGCCTQIGSNATILPSIRIGKNVIIGAGSVVTKDLPDNCLAVGVPAKIIKELAPLEF
ncbi:acetyltransferase [Flavobacterium granuli]|uniref:Sugar O-acyltransferase (Sialic acid O-acetyltransferase NeuD family) n=1 Tax=Flavobacterium granuli TaxID=280093 RepID=A0A1M5QKK4_9FLAO|nr:acetyltransferase [Flavobacterium granuli]PRZ20087.1 sugar O-acyltransferase (sialic acid O-acetyltransferase NeuD family) [Flavobacterium granuli]SHH14300.1 sugar O-acyltransferase, sialic acid O-acetyltransferase NeuD family [Flavobacterium granuli]